LIPVNLTRRGRAPAASSAEGLRHRSINPEQDPGALRPGAIEQIVDKTDKLRCRQAWRLL
jgi:hypothetical protein